MAIINRFNKVKDKEKIDIEELHGDEPEVWKEETVFLFPYSEYMETVLYNWLKSLSILKDDKLKMYKLFLDHQKSVYLAICEKDLMISEENRHQYESETCTLIRLEDMCNGRVVNAKLISRILREKEK